MRAEIANRQNAVACSAEDLRSLLRLALEMEGKDAELSIALVGDREIAALNKRFLGRADVTDVLAFPYESRQGFVAGEIIVNGELAARRADEMAHGAEDELMLYVAHGLLHLLGYDDHTPDDVGRMRERERAVLTAAGRAAGF